MNARFAVIMLTFLLIRVKTVIVRVEQGLLKGEILTPSTGIGKYYSFKGVPYAKPPMNNLRFKAPQSPETWNGIRNATEHGPICIQHITPFSSDITGNEDCLYLNIYSPNLSPKKSIPIMFFIHGGYFISGSGNSDLFAPDLLVSYNIVLVTINYRLDALGFLSVDTENVPGNAGLKDQIMALKWLKKNIRCFGGDPENVTIFGQSAGGVAVNLHIVSPAAKGLFHRAIGMSGAIFSDWAITFEHKKQAFSLGKKLGINTTDPNQLIDFLQKVPAEKLVEIQPNILISDKISHSLMTTFYFTPIIEKKFNDCQYLTDDPRKLLLKAQVNNVDFMAGHTQKEGLRCLLEVTDIIFKNYPQYRQLYVPVKISDIRNPKIVLQLADQIQEKYIKNKTFLDSIDGFVDYYSYSHFLYEIHYFFDKYSKVNTKKQYFYLFAIYSSRNFYSKEGVKFGIKKSTHRDDLPYLFDGSGYNATVDVKSNVFKYIDFMCRLYTNFAKYGNPTPPGSFDVIWPSYNQNKSYVAITDTLTVGHVDLYNGDLGFWHNIYSDAGVVPYMN